MAVHTLRATLIRLTLDAKDTEAVGTRVSNALFEKKWLEPRWLEPKSSHGEKAKKMDSLTKFKQKRKFDGLQTVQ